MPELPEVETIAHNLRMGEGDAPPLPGRTIVDVELNWPRHVGEPSAQEFVRRVRGRQVRDAQRRAKYLVFPLDRGALMIHLRMTGDLLLRPTDAPRGRYDHTVFHLDGGWELRFSDARKFGRVYWVQSPEERLADLGPEPLDDEFTCDTLAERLVGRRRALKPLLLDQSFLVGLGNIYADETLHRAELHPLTPADALTPGQIEALWHAIRTSLQEGIRNNGTSLDWVYRGGDYQNKLRVYGREGEPCPVCGAAIEKIVVGQRGTHFCPNCQPEEEAA